MLLAAFCPPDALRDELRAAISMVARAQQEDRESGVALVPRPGLLARLSGQRSAHAPPPKLASPARLLCRDNPMIPIAGFGNVTTADAARAATALQAAALSWSPPTVHFEGSRVGDRDNVLSVFALLGGEVDALSKIASSVAQRASELDFYLDRRVFQPAMEVATFSEIPSEADTSRTAASLATCRQTWTVGHVTLLRQAFNNGVPGLVETHRISIGC